MQGFQNILYVNAPSAAPAALRRAVQLANSNQARLTVVNVGEEFPSSLENLKNAYLNIEKEKLNTQLDALTTQDLQIDILHLFGSPFIEIIKAVTRGGYDLVIKPAGGRGGVSGLLFGSTDLHLLRKCPCPVWIIKPSKRKKYARVLAAVDPNPAEESNAELDALVMDLATSLAQREGSELHVVHAWKMPYESTLRSGRTRMSKLDVDRMVRETRKKHKSWFELLLSRYDLHNLSVRTHLLKGDPGDVIPALAKKKRIELIVMGTVARTGIPGFFIGNTAEKTLAAVDCSVLAVKPSSFSTPVIG